MKTEEEIRTKIRAIKNEIPRFLEDGYMYDRLLTRLKTLKWVLESEG